MRRFERRARRKAKAARGFSYLVNEAREKVWILVLAAVLALAVTVLRQADFSPGRLAEAARIAAVAAGNTAAMAAGWLADFMGAGDIRLPFLGVVRDLETGEAVPVSAAEALRYGKAMWRWLWEVHIFPAARVFLVSLVVSLAVLTRILRWVAERKLYAPEAIRGTEEADPGELARMVRRIHGRGRFPLLAAPGRRREEVVLPRSLENRGVFVVGAAGTGKTSLLARTVARALRDGERVFIPDVKGDYTARFLREGRDMILSPVDARSAGWSVLGEVDSVSAAFAAARGFVPPAPRGSGVEVYFRDAARDVLAGILIALRARGETSNAALAEALDGSPGEITELLLSNPETRRYAKHIQKADSNQAAGVLSTLVQFTRVVGYIPDGDFRIADWVAGGRGSIFLPLPPEDRDFLAPFFTALTSLLIRKALSLGDDLSRRIFLVIDELGVLNRVDPLPDLLQLGRSKGLSVWLGTQDFGRIDLLYGREMRGTIWNNCATRVVLRVVDPDAAGWLSRALGEAEVEEADETFSHGVEDVRDGASISRRHGVKPLVLPSEIQDLPDLHGYLKVADLPLARGVVRREEFPVRGPGLVRREITIPEPDASPGGEGAGGSGPDPGQDSGSRGPLEDY